MPSLLRIFWSSLKMALQELRVNKLRTFLSLFGVTIGIFCIIAVLATVNSLEQNVKNEIKSLGSNTIYIQKWPWGGGADYPWWKYAKRPATNYEEAFLIKERTKYVSHVAFVAPNRSTVSYRSTELQNVNWFGITDEYTTIQSLEISIGRYISMAEFTKGNSVAIIGYENASNLFGKPEMAIGKTINVGNTRVTIVGVIQKQGKNLLGGWDFDNIVIMPYQFCKQMISVRSNSDNFIMVKGKNGIALEQVKDELTGVMRSLRKLNPMQENDFALNDITAGTTQLNSFFESVNMGGWAIAILSLIVGTFGVANIMFVTIRERTHQIGIKKAVGAKPYVILIEFLLESAFLCILGGIIGLVLVYILTRILSNFFDFPITITPNIVCIAVSICIFVGVLAGIIPASVAARMDAAKAIKANA